MNSKTVESGEPSAQLGGEGCMTDRKLTQAEEHPGGVIVTA